MRFVAVLCTATLLTACIPDRKDKVERTFPPLPEAQIGKAAKQEGSSLAPLATPREVLQSVDVGRPDPFSAVLTPRLVLPPSAQSPLSAGKGAQKSSVSLEPPKGLVFQGVLEGPTGREALVEYAPTFDGASGVRSGSLRVGDLGTVRNDSLLPPGWRVRAIDVSRGRLQLQSGQQTINLEL